MNVVLTLTSVLLGVGIVALILATFKGNAKKRLVVKMIDSSLFVLLGVFALIKNPTAVPYAVFILIGAVFSFFGDLCLGMTYQQKKSLKNKTYVLGAFLFFLAQIAYSTAFITTVSYRLYLLIMPVLLSALIVILSRLPGFNIGKESPGTVLITAVYAFFVTFTFTAALNFFLTYGFKNILSLVALGGLFFLVSDYLLFHRYFFHRQYRLISVIYLSAYYLAQLIYAWSIAWAA